MHGRIPNLPIREGDVFGRLVVLSTKSGPDHRLWCDCQCLCGTYMWVSAKRLRNASIKSCGCLRKELAASRHTTHGKSRCPEYRVWCSMLSRCGNSKNKSFSYYGGRGISVCAEWLCFPTFIADMGHRPSPGHSLDRIDNNAGYCKENCQWATKSQQMLNRRKWRGRGRSKITEIDVVIIRALFHWSGFSRKEISAEYDYQTVCSVLANRTFTHVTGVSNK